MGDKGENERSGYRWTLEYIGTSRDDSSTPQHHLATLNSAAAASVATETMSEEASAAGDVQWPRGARSPPGKVRHHHHPLPASHPLVFR